mmetsp:Transcript_1461/g.2013  ORF Transcript_1461/g.2013 Transcript_1461/m.2013 type:complete len:117 (-) Transcript_1461:12-362(-)
MLIIVLFARTGQFQAVAWSDESKLPKERQVIVPLLLLLLFIENDDVAGGVADANADKTGNWCCCSLKCLAIDREAVERSILPLDYLFYKAISIVDWDDNDDDDDLVAVILFLICFP